MAGLLEPSLRAVPLRVCALADKALEGGHCMRALTRKVCAGAQIRQGLRSSVSKPAPSRPWYRRAWRGSVAHRRRLL